MKHAYLILSTAFAAASELDQLRGEPVHTPERTMAVEADRLLSSGAVTFPKTFTAQNKGYKVIDLWRWGFSKSGAQLQASILKISGCRDDESSVDGGSSWGGVMTNTFLKVVKSNEAITWFDAFKKTAEKTYQLRNHQHPQWAASRAQNNLDRPLWLHGGTGKMLQVGPSTNLKGVTRDLHEFKTWADSIGTWTTRTLQDKDLSGNKLPSDTKTYPNKVNFEREFAWLIRGAKTGDKLIFQYSGHGNNSGRSSDELDGKNEVLNLVDHDVKDDWIRQQLQKLPAGVQVFVIIDACRSGTVLDLRFRYVTPQYYKKLLQQRCGSGFAGWLKSVISGGGLFHR